MSARSHPVAARLDAFLLGELNAEESAALAAHLADCPECRAQVAVLRRALSAYAAAELPPPPPEVLAKVLAVQRQLRAGRRAHLGRAIGGRAARSFAAALVATAVFLSGFWLGQQRLLPSLSGAVEGKRPNPVRVVNPPAVSFQTVASDYLRGVAVDDTTGS